MIFGVVGLLVVVVIVGVLAKKQLHAVQLPPEVAGSNAVADQTPAQQSRTLQSKVQDDVNKALEQSKRRTDAASDQ
jgi:hypothetical protein